ncbi:MAG: hypothetical protein A2Z66_06850 [Chloroflexi bacterium RBG_13_66_10]|nr:MAG: hypothetical protein A2Z66_06850 [Chloroflexi bacterium RBG_13_66_10]
MRHLSCLALAALALAASACGLPQAAAPDAVATSVAGTLTASAPTLAPLPDTPTSPPPGGPSGAAGRVCYPSEGVPAMTAYFQNTATGQMTTLAIQEGQSTYDIPLPPGTYLAYAWLPEFAIGGAYTLAVPCGLGAECSDHSLIAFGVATETRIEGIDLCDWYGPEGSVPLPPGVAVATHTVTPTITRTATQPPPPATSSVPGGITGSLSYPSEGIPQLVVVAFNIDTGYWWWIGTVTNQSTYGFSGIPAGRYQVVAYAPSGLEAGYATGTSLRTIVVEGGQTASGINLTDWRPAGTFTAKPGGISYP